MRHRYNCHRCNCPLDPVEMPYCDECIKEMEEEAEQRKLFHMSIEDQMEVKRILAGTA